MDSADLAFAGAARQAELIRSREVSPRELVELCLDRIERLNPQLNAFRIVLAERALAEADQAAARLKAGEDRPLLGVPVAIKDSVDVAGELTTLGTDAVTTPATADAEMVRRLRSAGAIVVGKVHLPELAIFGFTESPTFGVTRNPWDPGRTTGGSSGGSGAAVAAGMVPIASASDGGGSIRIPAAHCGLFGLKPQRGRVSLMPHAEHWYGMSVNGCVSRTVADAALYLDVVSGSAPGDAHAAPAPERPFADAAAAEPPKLRIAAAINTPLPVPIDAELRRAWEQTAELLRSLGHEVSERKLDYGTMVIAGLMPRYLRGVHEDVVAIEHPHRLSRRTRQMGRMGALVGESGLRRARAAESRQTARANAIFADNDVVLTPVMAQLPARIGANEGHGALRTLLHQANRYPFTGPWNVTGQPAAAVPAGFAANGLPLSVQLVGRPNDEGTLLSLAAQLEQARPWADRRPALAA